MIIFFWEDAAKYALFKENATKGKISDFSQHFRYPAHYCEVYSPSPTPSSALLTTDFLHL